MSAALEFVGITKEYRPILSLPPRWGRGRTPVRALDDFSLVVRRGEIFGFLGANGAGKTTAIHIALGFMRATRGSGMMLGSRFGDAATRRRVGFLAENVALYHRPAERLVKFYGALNGMRDPELGQRARVMLEELELTEVAERNSGKFSRGMVQRLGLAQALVNDPELLVLDEPTSALDPAGRVAVRGLLQRARAAGKTIFLSSHLLSEVEMICDRIAILRRGKIARMGTTAELLEGGDEYEIVVRGGAESGADRAVSGGEDRGSAAREDGMRRLVVRAAEQRAAIERAWAAGGEVVRVNPVRRTLEELFLELTEEKSDPKESDK